MIRGVQIEDIDEIMIIERQSFPVAWEYSVFLNICLHGGKIISRKKTLFMDVMEQRGRIIGYAVWEEDLNKTKGHILNLAIRQEERRQGNGRYLLLHVINHLRLSGIRVCNLEVRESNLPARTLYERSGFIASSKISDYYFDEDAIVYSLNL